MTDAHEERECNFSRDGVCGLHGVEVERRKNMQNLTDTIPNLLTSMNRIIGYSTLLSMVIIAGFVYIRDVKQAVDYSHEMHKSDINRINNQISELTTTAARSEEKFTAMLRELENLNGKIGIWIVNEKQNQNKNSAK